jgi:hypothetical protein
MYPGRARQSNLHWYKKPRELLQIHGPPKINQPTENRPTDGAQGNILLFAEIVT